jgi:predicted RNA-binding protein associated with RNAse of E/G family
MKTIKLRFIRRPDEVDIWTHELIHQDKEVIISKFKFSNLREPSRIEGKVVVENDYTGICYEFIEKGLEVIKIFDFNEQLTGYYCNINTRPKTFDGGYEVVDLYLDVWVFPDLRFVVLDEEEFNDAVEKGLVDDDERIFAKRVLSDVLENLRAGNFPPRIVGEIG